MKIRYLGHSCFELTSTSGTKVITDPYKGVGYEMPDGLCADILTVSHGHFDHNYIEGVQAKRVLSTPEPFTYGGVTVRAIECYHDEKQGSLRGNNLIFCMQIDGLSVCHTGDIGEPCSPALVEKIGKVDVLFIPVGGTYTVDAAGASAYIRAIRPKTVIPMHYKPSDGSLDIDGISPFLKLCEGEELTHAADGRAEVTEKTHGILYMERCK